MRSVAVVVGVAQVAGLLLLPFCNSFPSPSSQPPAPPVLPRRAFLGAFVASVTGYYGVKLLINDDSRFEKLKIDYIATGLTPEQDFKDILEIGIGGGNQPGLEGFSNTKYYPASSNVVGLDPALLADDPRVKESNDLLLPHLKLVNGRAEALPFDDDSFDAVICTHVLCTVSDPQKVIQEVSRVLRKGGRFIFIEHVAAPDGSFLREQQELLDPLQYLLAAGCHLNRNTDRALLAATREQKLFSSVLAMDSVSLSSRWPAPLQVSGILVR
jgi:SAM-dependent methyltransferase